MTAEILPFPMGERMNSVWMARASGRFINKYNINPETEEYYQLMDTIQVCLDDEGAENWTKDELDELVDSFFREIYIEISIDPDNDA